MGEPFQFEFAVKDAQSISRRIRFATYNVKCKNSQFVAAYPLPTLEDNTVGDVNNLNENEILKHGWNILEVDLAQIMESAFNQSFKELASITIHSNCKLKTIVAAAKSMTVDELASALGTSHWPNGASMLSILQLPTSLTRFPSNSALRRLKQTGLLTPNAKNCDIDDQKTAAPSPGSAIFR
eukprot:Blabericola_migrator_1__6345@NODE_31_length_18777_cov_137_037787_g27_i0_p9_GENE_NODE_31_length_18777_cov_137_037787_g27_i0NODE_31_length_18777_cov_137_037787_g27_i0_p9_ORF_typecomplete_len182_score25_32DUF667/PF05018_13/2_2e19Dimerisation/PF08100_11/3_2e03Dimerisation/PF08100_11/0_055_NODE_31_length_18777_cov_137_037787_g27_i01340913954